MLYVIKIVTYAAINLRSLDIIIVSKGAQIRSQYNQVPHLTQDTNVKVTNSPLDNTDESQEVSPFPVYSVQIRDVGRFLAKFNPWTNTFGNRLVRLHCSRIHPSVKLHFKSIYL